MVPRVVTGIGVGRRGGGLPLAALVAAVAVASAVVARVTPAALLTPPARPETRFGGNAMVRTSGPT